MVGNRKSESESEQQQQRQQQRQQQEEEAAVTVQAQSLAQATAAAVIGNTDERELQEQADRNTRKPENSQYDSNYRPGEGARQQGAHPPA